MGKSLVERCEAAMAEGRPIDLTGCFQEASGPWAFAPTGYYPLLAGLTRTHGMSQVLDIGTKFGGSILAVQRGLAEGLSHRPVLVTVDLQEHQGHVLGAHPEITRIQGDAAGADTVARVAECFQPPIDMLYLDAVHTREHTRACFDSYTATLNPRFVVVDDIFLNDSMRLLWEELLTEFPADQIFDATKLTGRGPDCGFGVIEYRKA